MTSSKQTPRRNATTTAPEALGVLGLVALAACTAKAPEAKPSPSASEGLANGSFTADLDGFRIHYEVHGQGPVLMALTNSWGLSLEALRSMYRPLEEKLTFVYFDPRGMGGRRTMVVDPVQVEADVLYLVSAIAWRR